MSKNLALFYGLVDLFHLFQILFFSREISSRNYYFFKLEVECSGNIDFFFQKTVFNEIEEWSHSKILIIFFKTTAIGRAVITQGGTVSPEEE